MNTFIKSVFKLKINQKIVIQILKLKNNCAIIKKIKINISSKIIKVLIERKYKK